MGEVGCRTGLRLLWFLGCSSRRCTACQWHYRVTSQGASYGALKTCFIRCTPLPKDTLSSGLPLSDADADDDDDDEGEEDSDDGEETATQVQPGAATGA